MRNVNVTCRTRRCGRSQASARAVARQVSRKNKKKWCAPLASDFTANDLRNVMRFHAPQVSISGKEYPIRLPRNIKRLKRFAKLDRLSYYGYFTAKPASGRYLARVEVNVDSNYQGFDDRKVIYKVIYIIYIIMCVNITRSALTDGCEDHLDG